MVYFGYLYLSNEYLIHLILVLYIHKVKLYFCFIFIVHICVSNKCIDVSYFC